MEKQHYNYGMIGLGTMGRNLVQNMCEHGFTVAGFDKDIKQVELFNREISEKNAFATNKLDEFIDALSKPRVILMLVPAGHIVDVVIDELKPFLSSQDLLIDCGNSHFSDTNKRIDSLLRQNLHFMGVGISGGEEGARYGPSIMPGGDEKIYPRIAPVFEAISAKVQNEPCVAWLGPRATGHYVKMVHNGIEYGIMQLISEVYHLLKEIGGMNNPELQQAFQSWNNGLLNSFLIEITADIFGQKDELAGGELIDNILDSAKQKGTGKWASQDAMDLGIPIPAIDAAVTSRELSAQKKERLRAEEILKPSAIQNKMDKVEILRLCEQALYFSMITTYSQGMSLLYHASEEYHFNLQLETVAKIWRGGCIIRSAFLEKIRLAFAQQPEASNLMLNESIAKELTEAQHSIRALIKIAIDGAVPVPAMMASLAYFDGYGSGWLPSNLIQAQRDFFGAHTYERNDREGIFHTKWLQHENNGSNQ